MTLEHHKFRKAEIIDNLTVKAEVDGVNVDIEILHGGLPLDTDYVTVRQDMKTPSGEIILGAHIACKEMPITVVGRVK